LSALSKGDRTLAKDVRAAIVLTGHRGEVREATGAVLGGQLTATANIPLGWLNQWLPSGWQIAQRPTEAPATLEGKASFDVPALFDLFGRTPIETLSGAIDLSATLSASRTEPAATFRIAGNTGIRSAVSRWGLWLTLIAAIRAPPNPAGPFARATPPFRDAQPAWRDRCHAPAPGD